MRARLLALGLMLSGLALSGLAGAYTVRAGDTLWSLAQAHGLSAQALMSLNGLTSERLRVGQQLRFTSAGAQEAVVKRASIEVRPYQRGYAAYYGGRPDACNCLTAAHLSLPFGTLVRVTHLVSGRSVLVRINDRGPFGRAERVIDLSTEAARQLGMLSEGVAPVSLALVQGQ